MALQLVTAPSGVGDLSAGGGRMRDVTANPVSQLRPLPTAAVDAVMPRGFHHISSIAEELQRRNPDGRPPEIDLIAAGLRYMDVDPERREKPYGASRPAWQFDGRAYPAPVSAMTVDDLAVWADALDAVSVAAVESLDADEPQPGVTLQLIKTLLSVTRAEVRPVATELLDAAERRYGMDPWHSSSIQELRSRIVEPAARAEIWRRAVLAYAREARRSTGVRKYALLQDAIEPAVVGSDSLDEALARFGSIVPIGDLAANVEFARMQMQEYPQRFFATGLRTGLENPLIRKLSTPDEHHAQAVVHSEQRVSPRDGHFGPIRCYYCVLGWPKGPGPPFRRGYPPPNCISGGCCCESSASSLMSPETSAQRSCTLPSTS